jgi:1-acyl-sn-glycerol-3-phosphate acyltransferase
MTPSDRYRPIPPAGRLLWSVGPGVVRMAGRLGFSLRYEKPATLPRPPFVLASNHYSHLDPPAIGAVLATPIRFLALDDLFGANRFLAGILPAVGVITVSRRNASIAGVRTALAHLDAGEAVGVFPEGTRVRRWGDRPPRRGAAWLAVRTGVPLVPVAVLGTGKAMGLDNRPHRAPIRVVVGEPMPAGDDSFELTRRWADWVGEQLARVPETEIDP